MVRRQRLLKAQQLVQQPVRVLCLNQQAFQAVAVVIQPRREVVDVAIVHVRPFRGFLVWEDRSCTATVGGHPLSPPRD